MAIRYTRSGLHHLAYDTIGDGPVDLLHLTGFILPIDALDDEPHVARYYRRLSSFSRVIHFDPRGIGLSDPVDEDYANTVDAFVADAIAVLDALGCDQVGLVAWGASGPLAIGLAAQVPERVSALVLGNSYARLTSVEGYRAGIPPEIVDGFLRDNPDPETRWNLDGAGDIELFAPSLADDEPFREWVQRSSRRGASPGSARAYLALTTGADVRAELAGVQAPTLVLHNEQNQFVPRRLGRYVAAQIPAARLVLLSGADHMPWAGSADAIVDEIEEFVTGSRPGSMDRVLATVVFTDIVDSTTHVSVLGDAAWRQQLDSHDAIVRGQLARFGGREVNTTGDGFVATFDVPTVAVRAACAIVAATHAAGLEVRVGVHTGECERRGDDVAGVAVHIAARVAAYTQAGEVLVSRTVSDIVTGSGLEFESRGEFELKGVARAWELFSARP